MLPRRSTFPLPVLNSGASSPLPVRRSHVLYLLLLLTLASALGSWIHQLTARTFAGAALGAGAAAGGPQRLPAAPSSDSSSADPQGVARFDRLEAGVEALQRQLAQLSDSLPAAAAGTASIPAAAPLPAAPQQQQQQQQQQPAAAPAVRPRPMVLGMAKGLDDVGVYRFVRSLRTHSPDARIVIFTDQASLGASALLPWAYEAFGVEVQLFDVAALPTRVQAYHPSSYRWILMRDYLRAVAAEQAGGAVFFTDVRDTVFQGDLFARLTAPGLYAFQEQRPGTIAACGWNSGWVKDCFGAEGLAKVGHNVVSCSGTTAGSWADAMAYVELMAKSLEDMPHCERNGIDQGMHNYFVYSGALAEAVSALHLVSNEEGFIATVQSMPSVQRDAAGRVLNAQGAVVAAVHQYDRSPVLKQQYQGEFPLPPEAERGMK